MCTNKKMAAHLAEASLTQAELADAVNVVVEDLTGTPGRASDRWVRMLINGSIRWPRPYYRRALEIILKAPMEDLGFRCPVDKISANHATLSTTASQTRLGIADVARLGKPLDQLMRSADIYGAATLAPQAAHQASLCQDMLQGALVSERVERATYVLIGDYLTAAGWFALDSEDPRSAQRLLDAGLRAASIAREGPLQTYIWTVTEKSARLRGDYNQALAVVRAGLASTTARRDSRVRGTFHALAAINLSRRGEPGQAQRSLGRAFDVFDNTTNSGQIDRWSFANRGFITAIGASVSVTLGQLQQAERYCRQALRATPSNQKRNYALRQLSLARVYLKMHELDAACTHASCALTSAKQLDSRRVDNQLESMHKLLGRWNTAAVVRDWNAQYNQHFQEAGLAT